MTITASVVSQPITAAVSGGGAITANVGASTVSAAASGGIGPQGPAGATGPSGGITALSQATDVQLSNVSEGDVLRYSATHWQNYSEQQITDGGNF
jgi:hypothetical protein